MARVLEADQSAPSREVVEAAAEAFAAGGVVVIPTDSVYGIGCVATPDNPGHRRTFEIKRRDLAQTLPLLVADASDLDLLGRDVPAYAQRLAAHYWPGALTLVVRASERVPVQYRAADGTVALRVPDSELVRAIARRLGAPLAITSANTHGADAATSGASVEPRIAEAVDLVLDAGPAPLAVASTIVDVTGPAPRILREGALAADQLLAVASSASRV